MLMLATYVCVSAPASADEPPGNAPAFDEAMTDQVLSGIGEVSDAVSNQTDDIILPPGSANVLGAVVDGETSEPQTGARYLRLYGDEGFFIRLLVVEGEFENDGILKRFTDPIEYIKDKITTG